MTSSPEGIKAPAGVRPSVDDVALWLRARTKDSYGNEVGTFDDETKPTSDQVEAEIDKAVAQVLMRLPPVEHLPPELVPAVADCVACRTACRVERSYYPEQVRSDRSAYAEMVAECQSDLVALVERAKELLTGGAAMNIGMIPIRSWTSIPIDSIPFSSP